MKFSWGWFSVVLVALITIIGISIAKNYNTKPKHLKIFTVSDINPELYHESIPRTNSVISIPPFSLLNQEGDTITQLNYSNKIFVADFFFTTCPTICPKMTKQMDRVYREFINDSLVYFLSHTVYPEVDSVNILKIFADKNFIKAPKWNLLTGDKKQIYDLARRSYLVAKHDGDGGPNDFIHTENFILVDTKKRIRGYYDGIDSSDVNRLIEEIKILQQEL